jgi:hypothetical protein
MGNKLVIQSLIGSATYLQLASQAVQFVNGTSLEPYQDSHWANYSIAGTQLGTSNYWEFTIPAVAAGYLDPFFWVKSGASPAVGDPPASVSSLGTFYWDGTNIQPDQATNGILGAINSITGSGVGSLYPSFDINMLQGETRDWPFTILDENGNAVNLSGKTLRFEAYMVSGQNTLPVFHYVSPTNVTISGSGNNIVTVAIQSADTAIARLMQWALWDDTDDVVIFRGNFNVGLVNHA